MTGYSGTPLAKKLGLRPGSRVHTVRAPENYAALLAPLPERVDLAAAPPVDLWHLFAPPARSSSRGSTRRLRASPPPA